MKNLVFTFTLLVACSLLTRNTYAQQATSDQNNTPASQVSSSELKAKWINDYNAMKPKLDGYQKTEKQYGSNDPDFSRAVQQFNLMMGDFKKRIDNYGSATSLQRSQYPSTMSAFYERMKLIDQKLSVMSSQIKKSNPSSPK